MHKDIRILAVISRLKHPAVLLFCFGLVSLIAGTLLAVRADSSAFSLMRQAVISPVSIVCHLALQLLPFLIAAYAVSISRSWLLYTVFSCKLFSFAYTGTLVWIAFGSAGWLVRFLILFSDIILVPVFCWFCTKRLMKSDGAKDLWLCMGLTVITVLMNLFIFSPFLVKIIHI